MSQLFAWAGGAVLLCSAGLISLDVVFRALFKTTVFESFELSTYAFAIATAFGLAFALSSRAHIRIEVVYNLLPLRWRAWLDVFSYTLLSVAACVLLYWCAVTVFANAQAGARSNSALSVPMVIPQGLWLAGLAWFAIVAIVYSAAGLWTLLKGDAQAANTLLGVPSLQEEIEANAPDLPTILTEKVV
ncbi:TRAP transporter small permease subunit [Caenimonas soli]|uniref:TRAP transporter small permease subunit n=1 Tax=Caenimonas soli TaxID=2735555 RepID=UPI001554BC1D|nr:TRAP transporter small permease [Caenimonas soli]NPC56964.1 TRAP transporter small permease [Caenimonas soli]